MGGIDSFDIGQIAWSGYDGAHLVVTPDVHGLDKKEGAASCEVLHPYGWIGRPLDPDVDDDGVVSKGCGVLWARHGDELVAIPVVDPRIATYLPKAKKGGGMAYGSQNATDGTLTGASFAIFDGVDPGKTKRAGSFVVSAGWDADGTKKAHVFALNVQKDGKEFCELSHANGAGFVANWQGIAKLSAQGGKNWIAIGPDGNTISGPTKLQGSLAVGTPEAAQEVAIAKAVVAAINAVFATLSAVAAAGGLTAAAMSAAALAGQQAASATLALIPAKHLRST